MDRNNNIFSPVGVNFHYYANYVNEFSFVLSTNMAAMKTTYTAGLHQAKVSATDCVAV